jgi:hypothetical protein
MKQQLKGYLICEASTFAQPTIVSSSKTNRVTIKTTLQDADVRNRNKRIYPKNVIQSGLSSDYVKERIATKTFFGEAGHPLKPDIQRQLYMDQSNISHVINSFWWEGNVLKGYVEAANTARGGDFDGLIRQGSKVGFSLRAVGPITEKRGDAVVVCEPLTIFCYDWIIHPSHAIAYMDEVVSESGNVINESAGIWTPIYAQEAVDYIKNESKNFKIIAEALELDTNEIFLSEDTRKVYVRGHGKDTVAILTEDYISKEISRHMNKLRF